MTDNELIILFTGIIDTGLAARGYNDVVVIAGSQPTQQGAPSGPNVRFIKLFDHQYGNSTTQTVVDPDDHTMMIETQTQFYESTFQINTLVIEDPNNISYTASDLASTVALILNSNAARLAFKASNVGVLQITDIRAPIFLDELDRREYAPNFDFTLTHKKLNIARIPVIYSIETGIYQV